MFKLKNWQSAIIGSFIGLVLLIITTMNEIFKNQITEIIGYVFSCIFILIILAQFFIKKEINDERCKQNKSKALRLTIFIEIVVIATIGIIDISLKPIFGSVYFWLIVVLTTTLIIYGIFFTILELGFKNIKYEE